MGRIKGGFRPGEIVVSKVGISGVLTPAKEYLITHYSPTNNSSRVFQTKDYPKISIKDDRGLLRMFPCEYFMSKREWIKKVREEKLNKLL
jgi:hypothetical protein